MTRLTKDNIKDLQHHPTKIEILKGNLLILIKDHHLELIGQGHPHRIDQIRHPDNMRVQMIPERVMNRL